jgi:hypothetical protein
LLAVAAGANEAPARSTAATVTNPVCREKVINNFRPKFRIPKEQFFGAPIIS